MFFSKIVTALTLLALLSFATADDPKDCEFQNNLDDLINMILSLVTGLIDLITSAI
ncbi:hypothetical protein CEXT_47771, partial [Caerostris extrusa]